MPKPKRDSLAGDPDALDHSGRETLKAGHEWQEARNVDALVVQKVESAVETQQGQQ